MWLSWLLFSLRGRIRRRDWWVGVLALNLLYIVGTAVLVGRAGGELPADEPSAAETALSLLLVWPAVAMGVKREHDRDRSGWMAVLFSGLAPALFVVSQGVAGTPDWLLIATGLLALAGLAWSVFALGFRDGTPEHNRFGPSPKRFDPPDA